jgi:hypothetical protein
MISIKKFLGSSDGHEAEEAFERTFHLLLQAISLQ